MATSQPTPFDMSQDGFRVDVCGRAVVLPGEWPTDARSRKTAAANARKIAGLFDRLAELEAFRAEVEAAVFERRLDDFAALLGAFDGQEKEAESRADEMVREISRLETRVDELERTAQCA